MLTLSGHGQLCRRFRSTRAAGLISVFSSAPSPSELGVDDVDLPVQDAVLIGIPEDFGRPGPLFRHEPVTHLL